MFPNDSQWLAMLASDLRLVLPECILIVGMCAVILAPLVRGRDHALPTMLAGVALLAAMAASVFGLLPMGRVNAFRAVFDGMLTIDPFSQFFKLLLMMFVMLVVMQWLIVSPGRIDRRDVPDFLCLLLGATLGMSLMASANNLLMLVIATETASLPSFALAGFYKNRKRGSEAALKYVLFGAAASAVMIYGASLIYGCTGALELSQIAEAVRHGGVSPLLIVGIGALLVGLGFKLSAVPMHFWCPDVFEAAPVVVTTFLSVASKGAAVVLLLRVLVVFPASLAEIRGMAVAVGILGAVTATWGNLLAVHQNHLRRLLAYSSIAHAGYMIMAAAVICLSGVQPVDVSAAILFYLLVYLFMNLGAFTVGAIIANAAATEDIRQYVGMRYRSPLLAGFLALFLLSLFGMPGLGGFMGKIFLMTAMSQAGAVGYLLIAVLLINTVISLYYYLRPVYYMYLVNDQQSRAPVPIGGTGLVLLLICAVMLLWTGIFPGHASRTTRTFAAMVSYINPPSPQRPDGEQPPPSVALSNSGKTPAGTGARP